MPKKNSRLFPATMIATIGLLIAGSLTPGDAKTRKRVTNLLVPPPPAYMPSILPELTIAPEKTAPKPANPTKKYIYTREGYEEPTPVKPNKHITYWNNSEIQVD